MNKSKKKHKILIGLSLMIIGLWVLSWILITYNVAEWSNRGTFGDMFGAVNSLFSGLALIGITYSIYLQIEATQKDHDRRKKQSTIEYLNSISPIYRDLKNAILKEFGDEYITKDNIEKIMVDKEKRQMVRDYLNGIENMCVGVNTGVFDIDLMYRLIGSRVIKTYRNFHLYIKSIQDKNPTVYSELVHIAQEFEKRKTNNPSTDGKIE